MAQAQSGAAFDKRRGVTTGPGGSIVIAKGKVRMDLAPREIGDLLEVLLLALPPGPKRDYAVLQRQNRALVEGALASCHKALDATTALTAAIRELEGDAKAAQASSRARSCVSLGAMAAARQAELLVGLVALLDHGLLLPAAERASNAQESAVPPPPASRETLTNELGNERDDAHESARATLPPPEDGLNVSSVVERGAAVARARDKVG